MTSQLKLHIIVSIQLLLNCCGNAQGTLNSTYKLCIIQYYNFKGAVTISPPGNSLLCDGDQLELTCSITDPGSSLLEWTFTPTTIFMDLYRPIEPSTPSDQTTTHWMINSTLFTFSRISGQNEWPLVSRLLISPVTTGLNGTVVNCTAIPIMEIASTTVYVSNRLHNGMSINTMITRYSQN